MRATVMHGAGDVRVENVRDARLVDPTDALVARHPRRDLRQRPVAVQDRWSTTSAGRQMGHEFIGIVEAVGAEVRTVKTGDVVVAPFLYSDGNCVFCHEGLQSACLHGGRYGFGDVDGGQGEAVRVPAGRRHARRAARRSGRRADAVAACAHGRDGDRATTPRSPPMSGPGKTVAVVGDGAVGLCGVLAARRLGAERIIMLGRHPARIAHRAASSAPPTSSSERGDEAVERVRELSGGYGVHSVLECVGLEQSRDSRSTSTPPGGRAALGATPRFPRRGHLLPGTSRSVAASRRRARTSRSCCRMSWKGGFSPAVSSIASPRSTMSPTATGQWTIARRSRSWCASDALDGRRAAEHRGSRGA